MNTKLRSPILLVFLLLGFFRAYAQNANVRIDIQILDYDGVSEFQYYLERGNHSRNATKVQPDENGRISIQESIDGVRYLFFYYQNDNENDVFHRCKLVVEPNNHYTIISKGTSHDWPDSRNELYSPDIYSWDYNKNDFGHSLKMNYSQMYYNMFDNDTRGSIYHGDWDLKNPDSLLYELQKRIQSRKDLFAEPLSMGEITPEFYEIMSANIGYHLAYQLAQTLFDGWQIERFKIQDDSINQALTHVFDSIFTLYPVSDNRLSLARLSLWYVDMYLYRHEAKKEGSYTAPRKGSHAKYIDEIKPLLHPQVYKDYKMQYTMGRVASLDLGASKDATLFLEENEDLKNTDWGILTEVALIPRSIYFDSLANRPMNPNIIFLDDENPVQNIKQLSEHLNGKAFLLDLWGTWCSPCRHMFQYKDSLSDFLKQNNMVKVYAAYEYSYNRENWKKVINAYDLDGYHLFLNDQLKDDLEKIAGKIKGFPTYMIVNEQGKIIENKAIYPCYPEKLKEQILTRLKE